MSIYYDKNDYFEGVVLVAEIVPVYTHVVQHIDEHFLAEYLERKYVFLFKVLS